MKLSTRAKYGIHAVFDLAQHLDAPQSIKTIAQRQNVPEQYLVQLIAGLRKAGLVRSVRGAQGGYYLAKPPEEITLADMMHALEGPIALSDCLSDAGYCDKACACATKRVWERLSTGIDQVLTGVTLQDMLEDQDRLQAGEGAPV